MSSSTGEQIQLFKPFCSLFLPFLGQCPARPANKFSFSNPFVRFSCLPSGNVRLGRRTNSAFQPLLFACLPSANVRLDRRTNSAFQPLLFAFFPPLGQCPAQPANKFSFSNPFVRLPSLWQLPARQANKTTFFGAFVRLFAFTQPLFDPLHACMHGRTFRA